MLSYGLKSYDFAIDPSLVGTNVLNSGRRSDCNGSVTAEDFHLASPFKNAYAFTEKGYIYIRYIVSLIIINCKVNCGLTSFDSQPRKFTYAARHNKSNAFAEKLQSVSSAELKL